MGYSEKPVLASFIAGTTFADGDLYKFLDMDAQGHVIVMDTTGNNLAVGVLYGRTATTSTEAEAVPVAIGGVVKVRLANSTMAAGNWVAASSAGLGIAPSTDGYVMGKLVSGTSGTTGRIGSMLFINGPLGAP